MQLEEFANRLEVLQRLHRHKKKSDTWIPSATPVTDLGYACIRRSVYHRLWPEKASPLSLELASIFEEGDIHEANVRAELAELGFELLSNQTGFRDEDLDISGRIDGMLRVPTPNRPRGFREIPAEVKGLVGGIPGSTEDLLETNKALLQRYRAQITVYEFLTNTPEGLLLFKSKATGLWTVIPVDLDYGYAETLLQRAEAIRDATALIKDARRKGCTDNEQQALLPDRIPDRSECNGCPWRDTMCHPADAEVDPTLLAEDDLLGRQIARRCELDPLRREFADLDSHLKERFKLTKGERFIVNGEWLVTKKIQKNNSVRISMGPLKEKTA